MFFMDLQSGGAVGITGSFSICDCAATEGNYLQTPALRLTPLRLSASSEAPEIFYSPDLGHSPAMTHCHS
jgi:hypothetical protein